MKSYCNSRHIFTSDGDCRLGVPEQITGTNKEERDGAHSEERASSHEELQHFPRQHPTSSKEGDDFRAKEVTMRAASAENWAENELFNIKNAFDLQFKRLEVINTLFDVSKIMLNVV